MKAELNASKPLQLGVLVYGVDGDFWQQYAFENLPCVCFKCGRMGHKEDGCKMAGGGVLPAVAASFKVGSALVTVDQGTADPASSEVPMIEGKEILGFGLCSGPGWSRPGYANLGRQGLR